MWVTKLTATKHSGIKLTSKEKSTLVFEGFVTVGLLLLLNLAMLVVVGQIINASESLTDLVFGVKDIIGKLLNNDKIFSWSQLAIVLLGLLDVVVLYWRLRRRYNLMQMRHILNELHYIANGHIDHRIPFVVGGDLGEVVESINVLVDNTVHAMDEEREIEKSKDELITNVSHDIRTPLTSIIGYLGLIDEKKYESNDELLKYAHVAFIKSKQMKSMVDDLFEYSRVRQPSTKLNSTTFDMKALLEQLAVDFEVEAKEQDISIEVEIDENQMIMSGDTEKLVRVFNNLLQNAIKYGKSGQHIVISAVYIQDNVEIRVKNDGNQIPKESLQYLFDRFYRVDDSRSQETGGTGLGLAIAKSIVQLHEGKIYACSDKNWTSFVVLLPK